MIFVGHTYMTGNERERGAAGVASQSGRSLSAPGGPVGAELHDAVSALGAGEAGGAAVDHVAAAHRLQRGEETQSSPAPTQSHDC